MRQVRAGWVLVVLALLSCVLGQPASAESGFPSRSIKVVTPFAPGAASDIELRVLAAKLGERLGVSVIVENRTGAGGVVAARAVTGGTPDGYTIGWVGNNTAIGVSLFAEPFDPRKEMRPIVGISEFAYLFVTAQNSQYKTLQDVIAAARAQPNVLKIGTSAAGTSNNLAAYLFKVTLNLDVTVVPYRGPSELDIALLRNDVDLVVNAYAGLRSGFESNNIRALATTSATRVDELPDVPTMAELGFPALEIASWNGLYGPADMPQDTVDVIEKAVTEILGEPETKAKFKTLGFQAKALPASGLGQRMQTEIDRWGKVIAAAGINRQ